MCHFSVGCGPCRARVGVGGVGSEYLQSVYSEGQASTRHDRTNAAPTTNLYDRIVCACSRSGPGQIVQKQSLRRESPP